MQAVLKRGGSELPAILSNHQLVAVDETHPTDQECKDHAGQDVLIGICTDGKRFFDVLHGLRARHAIAYISEEKMEMRRNGATSFYEWTITPDGVDFYPEE